MNTGAFFVLWGLVKALHALGCVFMAAVIGCHWVAGKLVNAMSVLADSDF